jgi:hypothetical protein
MARPIQEVLRCRQFMTFAAKDVNNSIETYERKIGWIVVKTRLRYNENT